MSHTFYNSLDLTCKSPFGAVKAGQPVTFNLTVPEDLGYVDPHLVLTKDCEDPVHYRMEFTGQTPKVNHFALTVTPTTSGLYFYHFDLYTDFRRIYRTSGGEGVLSWTDGQDWQLTVYEPDFKTPDWLKNGTMYQIFPDRFCEGKPNKTMPFADRIYRADKTGEPYFWPTEQSEGYLNMDYYGGDFAGIQQKLPYLRDLGVTCIYLNPIFEAHANHRYNTADYLKADPLLGTNEEFSALCAAAAKEGIRIILDGVFSHTGSDSRYFNREGRYGPGGAYRDRSSPYRSWYDFDSGYPCGYRSWWGFETLPEVQEESPSYVEFICGKGGVIDTWLNLGASGFRLDVADELPDDFIAGLNAAAKQEKPDALVIGEVWEDASNKIAYSERRRYFGGGELDSVMNYPLRDAILAYLNGGTAEHFAETMETLRENYPRDVFYNLMNIIGTHDTARALTVLGVMSEDWKKSRDERAHYELPPDRLETAKRRLRLAAVIQFTMPGSPTIYYGDEAGRQGFEDPFNRRTYPWGAEDREILAFYRRLCEVRADSETLIRGELRFDTGENDALLRYERTLGRSRIIILVNRSRQEVRTGVNALYALDLLTQREFDCEDSSGIEITVPAETAYLLRCFGSAE